MIEADSEGGDRLCRLLRGRAARHALEEGVDQAGKLIDPRPSPFEQPVQIDGVVARPARDELLEESVDGGHDSSHSRSRFVIRERAW